jgi:predicted PurR-regulated permease PerM
MARPFLTAALIVAAAVLVGLAADVLLLLFAGVLLAVFLRALASWRASLTGLRLRWSLFLILAALAGAAALVGSPSAPRVAEQVDPLSRVLPEDALGDRVAPDGESPARADVDREARDSLRAVLPRERRRTGGPS